MTRVHEFDGERFQAFIVFDFDDAPSSAGGTRYAPDVTVEEVTLLARAMTYKFAVLGAQLGGAKAGIRADPADRSVVMDAYCQAIRPLIDTGEFLTGPDLGTFEADFAALRAPGRPHVIESVIDGVPFEDLLTGFGVVVAADAATGGLDGRTVALEGFGKVGGGVAREVARRGGRVVAVSTVSGMVAEPTGFDVDELWGLRAEHGDGFVHEIGPEVRPPEALFEVECELLVPGARTGVIDESRAAALAAGAVVPASNVPYTEGGLRVLRERAIPALADFVCNAGAVIGYRSRRTATPDEVLADVDRRLTGLVEAAAEHPEGPFAGAVSLAEEFLTGWRGADRLPDGPPLA